MSDYNHPFQTNGYRAPTKWIQKSTQHLLLVSSDSVRVFSDDRRDSHKDRRSKERSSVALLLWKLILRGFPNLISGFCRLSESVLVEVVSVGGGGSASPNTTFGWTNPRKVAASVKSHSEYFKVLRAARLTNRSSQRPRWSWRRQQRRGMEGGGPARAPAILLTSEVCAKELGRTGSTVSCTQQQLLSLNKAVTHVLPIVVEKLRKWFITAYACIFLNKSVVTTYTRVAVESIPIFLQRNHIMLS